MDPENTMMNMITKIKENKYSEAAEIFQKTPILNYETENSIFKLNLFEFYSTLNKNPVFLRVLLNYISLINILLEQNIPAMEFHKILLYFSAKFSYEKLEEGFIKLVLMAKTTIEVYNCIFQNAENAFENIQSDVKMTIDFKFQNKNEESIGYTFQELARLFLNDYIIGRNKGEELPNIIFYIKSVNEIQNLIGKYFIIPTELKLNLNENNYKSGINEFDHVLLLKDDIKIDENNPYFRYIKTVVEQNNSISAIYKELELKKNEIYIFEFKHSCKMNETIANIQNLGNLYLKLYNNNIYDIKETFNFISYKILYFYNYFENLSYWVLSKSNLDKYGLDSKIWKFCYLTPSNQIMQVSKLSSKIIKLEKRVTSLEEDNKQIKKELDLNKTLLVSQNKPNININFTNIILKEKKVDKFFIDKDLSFKIEEDFKSLSAKIKKEKDLYKYNELFVNYETGIKIFLEKKEKLEIKSDDQKWKTELKEEIKDDKTCFEIMAPCIGYKKASNNYFKIQKYFLNKVSKKDEISEIYQYVYYCFFGRRKLGDKKPNEKFYAKDKDLQELLINIIKYTFYLDEKRNEKEYYLLVIFKELLTKGNDEVKKSIFELKNRSLYQLVLMTIDLINSENNYYRYGYAEIPKKFHI